MLTMWMEKRLNAPTLVPSAHDRVVISHGARNACSTRAADGGAGHRSTGA